LHDRGYDTKLEESIDIINNLYGIIFRNGGENSQELSDLTDEKNKILAGDERLVEKVLLTYPERIKEYRRNGGNI